MARDLLRTSHMGFELTALQRPVLDLRPTAALVAYAQLLAVPAHELERLVERELRENPALERAETAPPTLRSLAGEPVAPREPADEPGLLERLAIDARASLPPRDHAALEFLLGSIDDRGFLTLDPARIALAVGAPRTRVEAVHALVRALGPLGFASRDVRDCLDTQLGQLDADARLVALARRLVAGSLDDLAAGRYGVLARRLGVDRGLVIGARDLIRARLRPFPVLDAPLRGARHEPGSAPDIVIALDPDNAAELRIELTEEYHCAVRVSPSYDGRAPDAERMSADDRRAAAKQARGAQMFVRRLHERWSTMRSIIEHTVHEQRAFVLDGPSALRPLTRAHVAAAIGVHESTVSRAVAGRSALLPRGSVVELKSFFSASLSAQDALRQIVARETRAMSDDELAVEMSAAGHPVARRTVAKYRSLLDIAPSGRR
jgi:RNA polymerase sigma-54 factor